MIVWREKSKIKTQCEHISPLFINKTNAWVPKSTRVPKLYVRYCYIGWEPWNTYPLIFTFFLMIYDGHFLLLDIFFSTVKAMICTDSQPSQFVRTDHLWLLLIRDVIMGVENKSYMVRCVSHFRLHLFCFLNCYQLPYNTLLLLETKKILS